MSRERKALTPPILNAGALRRWLLAQDLTQKELAARMGARAEYLGKVMNEQVKPSLDFLMRLGEATGEPWYTFVLPDELTVVPRKDAETLRGLRSLMQPDLQAV